MWKLIEPYILTFIPIFVAVDVIGIIPLFMVALEGLNKKQKKRIVLETILTAASIAISFMFIGKLVLRLIGVTIPDFQVAGGLLLLVIAIKLLLPGGGKVFNISHHERDLGVFPLGTPLITGPAVLTTTLIMLDTYGIMPTFVSLLINMVIVWLVFVNTEWLMKILGQAGSRVFAKIMYILLAAIAVMMIRRGVTGFMLSV